MTKLCVCFFIFFASHILFASPSFLVVTDIHYGKENDSEVGHDSGPDLFLLAMEKIKQLSKKVDFIITLGDFPAHLMSRDKKTEAEAQVFHGLYQADQSRKPMFYIPGNNDSLEGNYMSFEAHGVSPLTYATDWIGSCVYCKSLLIDARFMNSGGYYSSYVSPKNQDVVLIALNTTPWAYQHPYFSFWTRKYPHQDQDAVNELKWLEEQLKKQRAKQLLIAMHIPPGVDFKHQLLWQPDYLKQFIYLLNQYNGNYGQISILTGHTHMDSLKKIILENKVPVYIYGNPSISRDHKNNSGMKVYYLNQDLYLHNFVTYYTQSKRFWGDDYYQARGGKHPIFPCTAPASLAQCLSSMSADEVCNRLDGSLFFTVKSDKATENRCRGTYLVE